MITYTWNINNLKCCSSENNLQNVIKFIDWTLTGTDENGITTSISNIYPLLEINPNNFVPYESLTEEIVINWLESNLDVGYLKEKISNVIADQYDPIIDLPIPWI